MVTLNAPDGQVLADVTDNVDTLVTWMVKHPQHPRWVYSQDTLTGTLKLKDLDAVEIVNDFLWNDIGG